MDNIQQLQNIIDNSEKIVFFGGAGVSTESGIPDFRSVDGLYNQKYDVPPETMLSHSYFVRHTEEFFRFYRDKMIFTDVKPNPAHYQLAALESKGKLTAVITQNIDGLHTKAGNKNVYELHGSVLRNYCEKCGKFYDVQHILNSKKIPLCQCGGIVKPDVVLYEEALDARVMEQSIKKISDADTLIIAGTSLTVYPAAGLIRYFKGSNLVLINRDETSLDGEADLVIHGKVGEVLSKITI